jgi:eukaryotic-like serine/threonine-protein kinase
MAATPLTSPERYELIDRIAVGGMAEVFRAVAYGAHGFEKTLAIKRILPELARDPEFEDRFIGEAKLAVKLTHANVVQVLDFGRLSGTLFIAMELVDGLDLAALLRRYRERGRLIPVPAAFHMAVEIARGLDFAHQHGVVHRDVSPSNILISRAGEVKIADFGIAQAAGDRRAIAADRRRIMGKWRYMSPEQARGEPLGTRSDLFSAAAVWFELFTGEKLFPGDDADAIIDRIFHMPIPSASERRPALPPRLDEVLRHALERDPIRRPDKAADVLRALVEISYESSIVATALDVAAAVKEALDAGAQLADGSLPPRALDDLIRQQLLPVDDPSRRTAVGPGQVVDPTGPTQSAAESSPALMATPLRADGETSTGVTLIRRGIGADGMTHWELHGEVIDEDRLTLAAVPSALRTGRRASEAPPLAEVDEEPAARPGSVRRLLAALVALASLVAIGGTLAWRHLGEEAPAPAPVVAPAPVPAPPGPAVLVIESVPPGARVRLDGRALASPTPTSAQIGPEVKHRVELDLAGYRSWVDRQVSASAGEKVRMMATLVAQRASLNVVSRPPGAAVELDGELLGETPLHRDDVRPGKRQLVLRKPDYKPITRAIDLVEDKLLTIDERMESAIVYGKVKIHIQESWAEVSLGGRGVGRAPGILKLPVGHQRLRLYNPFSKREQIVSVEVRADEVMQYEFEL